MFIYRYIYIYVHTYICIYSYIGIYLHVQIFIYVYIYIYIFNLLIIIYLYKYTYIYMYMAASHLRAYAGVSAKVSGGRNAEVVRRESEWPLGGSRRESARERIERRAAQRRASALKCCT